MSTSSVLNLIVRFYLALTHQPLFRRLKDGEWVEPDIDADPMIGTSLRLPKSLLDWVREQARDQHLKPTALIRIWIEEKRASISSLEERVERLENTVFKQSA